MHLRVEFKQGMDVQDWVWVLVATCRLAFLFLGRDSADR